MCSPPRPVAFDLIEADFIRPVKPGEMVVVEDGKLDSYTYQEPKKSASVF